MTIQDKEQERRFFDEYAARGEYDVLLPGGYRRLLDGVERARRGLHGVQVDAGCGTGAFTARLLAPDFLTVALDISHESLRRVREQIPAPPLLADIERLPFADGSIDFLVFSGVLHHFPDYSRAAAEAHRVLRSGGRGLAYDPNEGNPVQWLFRSPRSPFCSAAGRTANEHNLRRHEVERIFRASGFSRVEVRSISGIGYRKVAGQGGLTIALYNTFERFLELSRLEKAIGSFLLTTFEKESPRSESAALR